LAPDVVAVSGVATGNRYVVGQSFDNVASFPRERAGTIPVLNSLNASVKLYRVHDVKPAACEARGALVEQQGDTPTW
jgi:hypothetical protein